MAAPLYEQREILVSVAQEWVVNGRGFPKPIFDEMFECSLTREDMEINHPFVPKGTFIRVPKWFIELSRELGGDSWTVEEFDVEVRRRALATPQLRIDPQVGRFAEGRYVFPDWELMFSIQYPEKIVIFWGAWKITTTLTAQIEITTFVEFDEIETEAKLFLWEKSLNTVHASVAVIDQSTDQILRDLETALAAL